MMVLMLLPNKFKYKRQKKYFDFAAKFELNDMYHHGVAGVKVKMFSSSMDTPGRAELQGRHIHLIHGKSSTSRSPSTPRHAILRFISKLLRMHALVVACSHRHKVHLRWLPKVFGVWVSW